MYVGHVERSSNLYTSAFRSEIFRTFKESLLSTINATRDPAEETLANIAPTIATRLDGISRQTAPLMTMMNSLDSQLSRVVGFMRNVGANARSIFEPGADAEPTTFLNKQYA